MIVRSLRQEDSFVSQRPQKWRLSIVVEIDGCGRCNPFKVTVRPSFAINPPATLYIAGADPRLASDSSRDSRAKEVSRFIALALTSGEPGLASEAEVGHLVDRVASVLRSLDKIADCL
ncbi:MAG: hypothetical protein QOH88_1789 [Verrucomicrobiota bacterium]|jgi:hypothetical protein